MGIGCQGNSFSYTPGKLQFLQVLYSQPWSSKWIWDVSLFHWCSFHESNCRTFYSGTVWRPLRQDWLKAPIRWPLMTEVLCADRRSFQRGRPSSAIHQLEPKSGGWTEQCTETFWMDLNGTVPLLRSHQLTSWILLEGQLREEPCLFQTSSIPQWWRPTGSDSTLKTVELLVVLWTSWFHLSIVFMRKTTVHSTEFITGRIRKRCETSQMIMSASKKVWLLFSVSYFF